MAKIGRNDCCPCGSGKKYKHCCQNESMNPMDELKAALHAHGEFADEDEVGQFLENWNQHQNDRRLEDCEGLTPHQMHDLIYAPFESSQLVQFLSEPNVGEDAPINKLLAMLADAIGEKGLKPTAKGNLPRALCRDIALAYWGEQKYQRETKFMSIRSEPDFAELHKCRIVSELAGIVRKDKGRFILGRAARRAIDHKGYDEMYPRLFRTYAEKFNWAYEDCYPELFILQQSFAYTLYLFHLYGDQYRPLDFYCDLILDAFPMMLDEVAAEQRPMSDPETDVRRCYKLRIIERGLKYLGLVELKKTGEAEFGQPVYDARRTALMDRFVVFQRLKAD